MQIEEQLTNALEPPDLDEGEKKAPFEVTNKGAADWALRKLAKARAELADNAAYAQAQKQRIDEWLADVNKAAQTESAFFEMCLTGYHHRILAEDPDAKTVKLPNGVLKSRKRPDGVDIDDDVFLTWARSAKRYDLIHTKVTESVDRNAVKQAALKDGEVFPGVTALVGDACPVTFSVEVTT